MFRAQANPMDEVVVKATDENLTSENWSLILDVCDQVSASPSGPTNAISSLIKRLAHRNANVQLYTLELANALSQNCGIELHRELASKAFTEALLRLAADRNSHAQVKQKVLERMGSWTEDFKSKPELGIMEQAYQKLRLQQPGLLPPSKPVKREISSEDRKKEDDELQMALALSIKDKGVASPSNATPSAANESASAQAQPGAPAQQGTTAATVSRVRALYDFTPSEPGELAFRKNDIIAVLESVYKDWWKGSLRGQTGIFPLNYVEKLQDPTKEELERDALMESEVFGEIRNVEKLLALLSVGGEDGGRRGQREEDEISELYQRTLSIRPKLIELIARYSQKKDDFTQLNEKFIKARRDYEALLESSMSQPPYQQYPVRTRPPGQQMYPHQPPHQHPSHGGLQQPPPQNYAAQGPPPTHGFPPTQPFPQPGRQQLPPQQDPQRFYSSSPAEPPPQQPNFSNAYPTQNGPPPAVNAPAPFHFIPGGVQGPPPAQTEVRRKPSPQGPPPSGPSDPYTSAPGFQPVPGFQGQLRPNSIHTLNSGNPSELATTGYESPIDNRLSYPAAQMMGPPMQQPPPPAQNHGYDAYPAQAPQVAPSQPPPSAPPTQPRTDRDGLPSRQRTASVESPSSPYSSQVESGYAPPGPTQTPSQPSGPPPGVPGGSNVPPGGYQAYQPYTQAPLQHQARAPSGSSTDPGDFYR